MRKKVIKLTESQLKTIVENSIKEITIGGADHYEYPTNEFSSEGEDFDDLIYSLGYKNGYHEFFNDNPAALDNLKDWIMTVPEFEERLSYID
jgi:hypothetical protein